MVPHILHSFQLWALLTSDRSSITKDVQTIVVASSTKVYEGTKALSGLKRWNVGEQRGSLPVESPANVRGGIVQRSFGECTRKRDTRGGISTSISRKKKKRTRRLFFRPVPLDAFCTCFSCLCFFLNFIFFPSVFPSLTLFRCVTSRWSQRCEDSRG